MCLLMNEEHPLDGFNLSNSLDSYTIGNRRIVQCIASSPYEFQLRGIDQSSSHGKHISIKPFRLLRAVLIHRKPPLTTMPHS